MAQYSRPTTTVTHTVNVLPALLVLSALIALAAWAFGFSFWWALLPFALWFGLVFSLMFLALAFMFVVWAAGGRIKVTGRNGQVRHYRHFHRVP